MSCRAAALVPHRLPQRLLSEEGLLGSPAHDFIRNRLRRVRPHAPGEEVGQRLVVARATDTFGEVRHIGVGVPVGLKVNRPCNRLLKHLPAWYSSAFAGNGRRGRAIASTASSRQQ